MKTVLRVRLVSTTDNTYRGSATLELTADFTPSLEIGYDLPPFTDSRKPKTISLVVEEGHLDVFLGNEEWATEAACEARADEFRHHGWEVQ
jgi:hypothetical protein